ncbi:MAG TPA: peptide deformylase [Kofleriaceae bacterium]
MPTLKIVQVGDPVLRAVADAVPDEMIGTPGFEMLVTLMRDTMREAPGVGLAAPQIGESVRIVVIEDAPAYHTSMTAEEAAARERAAVPYHVLVNPVLTIDPAEIVDAFEGCLSFDGFLMMVPRARTVTVNALDEHGKPFTRTATGWYARILQHEVDHLNGIVCCDRMDPRTLMTVQNHGRRWRGMPVAEVREALNAPRKGAS